METTSVTATGIPEKPRYAQENFAQEVRNERLSILWKVTLVLLFVLLWIILILTTVSPVKVVEYVVPIFVAAVGSIGTSLLLRRGRYESAVWSYVAGLVLGLGIATIRTPGMTLTDASRDILFGAFPLLIILTGLMLPTRSTLIAMAISVVVIIVFPQIGQNSFTIEKIQVAAVIFTVLGTGIAAQMAGELYGIADWALESYRKERKFKEQLFDTQQEVQRSFMRQKALTKELQEMNGELESARSAALEAKTFRGQFLANMSHELRTPLNAIIGFSETMLNYPMMYENIALPEAYKGDMLQIYTSGKHLLQLINDILDLSKVDAGKLELEIEEIDLAPAFKAVMSTAHGLVGEKPIKLIQETAPNLPSVTGDSLRLRQVMLNLLSNAAKFTDEGAVTLGARNSGNGEVVFWVSDTGIGIAPEEINTIFEEFRQGASGRRKGRAGSGLGLAICRQLLSLMGGRLWAESTIGQGSTFFFTLPIYQPEPAAPEPVSSVTETAR